MSTDQTSNGGLDGRLQSRQVEMILSQLDSLPTLPEVATQLLHLTSSDRSSAAEVIELISADQSLTARILSLAARVDSGIRREARTIAKAVVLLGFETIRSIVMSIKVFEMFEPSDGPVEGLDRREFWKHCVAVACAAELLATRMKTNLDPEEMFVCGLLHDIGKLALEQCLPKSYTRIVQTCNSQCSDISIFERELIGVDHTVAGRRLAQIWQLPAMVENVIWLHHQEPSCISDNIEGAKAIGLINLADTIAREHRFGYSGNFTFPADAMELASRLGLSGSALGDTIDKLPGTIEKRAQMMGLGETTSESLFRSALSNANEELGRLNRKYHARSVQASVSTRGLKLLVAFARGLSGRDTIGRVCQQIASTWEKVCNIDTEGGFAGAYILSRRDDTAIIARSGGDGRNIDLIPTCKDLPMIKPPADGITARQAFETFAANPNKLPDWLGDKNVIHKPLVSGSVWVGGLIWPAEIDNLELTGDAMESLCATMAFAAAATEMRDRGQAVAEQLATASQKLYQTQKSLAESRTLAVVGEMAAGAAHEINNPLTVISGRAQLMAVKSEPKEAELWQNIADQSQTISDIVTDLMAFSQPGSPKPVDVQVTELVKNAIESYLENDENKIKNIKTNINPESLTVYADPAQITSVLSELLTNAGRSFETGAKEEDQEKGKSADADVPKAISIEATANPRDGQVLIKVVDNGRGMQTHVLDQAFTPFFSSMKAGRHRGMGLSRAKRFVELASGKIWIKSAPGAGATVYLSLPAGNGTRIVEQSE